MMGVQWSGSLVAHLPSNQKRLPTQTENAPETPIDHQTPNGCEPSKGLDNRMSYCSPQHVHTVLIPQRQNYNFYLLGVVTVPNSHRTHHSTRCVVDRTGRAPDLT